MFRKRHLDAEKEKKDKERKEKERKEKEKKHDRRDEMFNDITVGLTVTGPSEDVRE